MVTLTTDWGDRDYFQAMVKGRMYSMIPGVTIVDLSHSQVWDGHTTTANIIRFGCFAFPAGTVHVIDVGFDQDKIEGDCCPKTLIASVGGHRFVCSSRKLFELAIDRPVDQLAELPVPSGSATFLAYTQYCDVVARLLSGEEPLQIGEPCAPLRRRTPLSAQSVGDRLSAMVTGVDSYGNAFLNITYDDFERVRAGRRFRVELEWRLGSNERYETVSGVSNHYSNVRVGELLLTVSATGYMQLAVNRDSAARLVGLSIMSRCSFIFY